VRGRLTGGDVQALDQRRQARIGYAILVDHSWTCSRRYATAYIVSLRTDPVEVIAADRHPAPTIEMHTDRIARAAFRAPRTHVRERRQSRDVDWSRIHARSRVLVWREILEVPMVRAQAPRTMRTLLLAVLAAAPSSLKSRRALALENVGAATPAARPGTTKSP